MLLARRGLDVLLVDRARFPSDIPHGHFIHRHGPRRLAGLGPARPRAGDRLPAGHEVHDRLRRLPADRPRPRGRRHPDGPRPAPRPRSTRSCSTRRSRPARSSARATPVQRLRRSTAAASPAIDGERRADRDRRRRAQLRRWPSTSARRSTAPAAAALGLVLQLLERRARARARRPRPQPHRGLRLPDQRRPFAVFVAWPLTELARVKADIEAAMLGVVDGVPGLGEQVRAGERVERLCGRDAAAQLRAQGRTGRAGRWSATPAATRTRSSRSASATPSATPSCWPTRWPRASAARRRSRRRSRLRAPPRRGDAAGLRRELRGARTSWRRPSCSPQRQTLRGDQAATDRFYLVREGMVPA